MSALPQNTFSAGAGADDASPPVVLARRAGRKLVVTCPFCGKRHAHGDAGELGPRHGHRLAHCGVSSCFGAPSGWSLGAGYYLVEDERAAPGVKEKRMGRRFR